MPSPVPYNPLEVTPESGVPNAEIRSEASPQDFGSQIAEGNIKAGENVEDTGAKFLQMATESKAENMIANQFVPAAAQLKANFMQNKGMDAVKAQPAYLQSVENLRNQFLGQTNSPYEKQIVSQYMVRHAMQETDRSAEYAGQQQTEYETQTHNAMLDTYSNNAAENYKNPDMVDASIKRADALVEKRGHDLGENPDVTIPYKQALNRDNMVKDVVDAAVQGGDIPAAVAYYNKYKDTLSSKGNREIGAVLNTKMIDHDSDANFNHIFGQNRHQYDLQAYGPPQGTTNPGMDLPGANKPIPGLGGLTGAQVPPVSPQEIGQPQPAAAKAIDTNGKAIPSQGDYFKANFNNIIQQTNDLSEQQRPGDINYAEKNVAHARQHMNAVIEGEKQQNEARIDTVTKAINGDLPMPNQIVNARPEVQQAWNDLKQSDPKAAAVIENKMVGSKSDGKLGSGFSYLQQQAYAGKISTQDLLYHVGDDLTQEGFKTLHSVVKDKDSLSAADKSDNDSMATFLKYGHDKILHSSLFQNTPEAEQQYQAWFSSVTQQIKDGQRDKKIPLASMLDKNSKDYVGGNIDQFLMPVQKQLSDRAARVNGLRSGITNVQPRLPGETPEEYFARVK